MADVYQLSADRLVDEELVAEVSCIIGTIS